MDAATATRDDEDLELRLVDPLRNRFRLYGLTECRTLFGELCLRIAWGRIGHRRLRERSEVFGDRESLLRRREELLGRRRRHGYVSTSTPRAAARARSAEASRARDLRCHAIACAILEQHGLSLGDAAARKVIARWRDSTLAIVHFVAAKGGGLLDLVDASTLGAMFADASAP